MPKICVSLLIGTAIHFFTWHYNKRNIFCKANLLP